MATDAVGQRRHDRLVVRRQPALAAVAHHPRGEYQILDLVRLVALELRTRWMRHPQYLGLRYDPRCHLAAAATIGSLAARLRLASPSIQNQQAAPSHSVAAQALT